MKAAWFAIPAVLLFAVAPVLYFLNSHPAKPVEVAKAAHVSIAPSILASGTLVYESQVTLVSELVARVEAVLVKEGAPVRKGEVVIRLDAETTSAEPFARAIRKRICAWWKASSLSWKRLLNGELDFYIGPQPEQLPREFRSELYFHNERVVVARSGHPLLGARSLKQLVQCEWILTGLRQRVEQEFEELFNAYKLPAPRSMIRVESTLALLAIVSGTDAVALLPRQWTDSPMFKGVIGLVPVKEKLMAPDIVRIARAGVPLTPVAEHFGNLLMRAAGRPYG